MRDRHVQPDSGDAVDAGGLTTRIFILSYVRLVREALALALSRQPGLAIVGAGEPSTSAVDEFVTAKAELALLDMTLSGALDIARELIAVSPFARIVAFSVAELDEEVLACAEAGMVGFVSRGGTTADLVTAIEHAMRGELRCSPRVAALLLGRVAALGARVPPNPDLPLLTQRERQIGGLIEQGLSNKAIAKALQIGPATVKNHVHSILDKFQVHRRGEAAARLRGRVT